MKKKILSGCCEKNVCEILHTYIKKKKAFCFHNNPILFVLYKIDLYKKEKQNTSMEI